MTVSPTPGQSARGILGIFKSRNCYAGDPLQLGYIKIRFLENHGSAADCTAGVMYAEDNGWLEVTPPLTYRPISTTLLPRSSFSRCSGVYFQSP